jgi:hypothetical protein
MPVFNKKLAEQLAAEWTPRFMKSLKLAKSLVNVHVHRTTSKKLKKSTGDKYTGLCGCCYSNSVDCHDIIIFYDSHFSKKQFLSTLLHELLHVKMSKLSSLVTMKESVAYKAEENIVRDLELMIIDLIDTE